METERRRVKIKGCLMQLPKDQISTRGDIIHCGECPNHTVMIGTLSRQCKYSEENAT